MENEKETCGVCFTSYDAVTHIPRVLVNCGHTLCSSCLIEILKSPKLRKCPYDNLAFKRPQKCLANFPINFALLTIVDGKNQNICKVHGEKLGMFCLQDKVKICIRCALFGEHKGHSIGMIEDLKAHGEKLRIDLEKSFGDFEKNQLEKDCEVDLLKTEFLSKIGSKFEETERFLREKKLEFTKQMESLFERSEEKNRRILLRSEVERALEGIAQGENLGALCQDFSPMISSLQPQDVKQEALKFSNEGSNMMDCMEPFFKSIKDFDVSNQIEKMKQKKQQLCSENMIEIERSPPVLFQNQDSLYARSL